MNHSLVNKNQVRELNITVHDNPFDATVFGIEVDISFILFTSKGTVIIFGHRSQRHGKSRNYQSFCSQDTNGIILIWNLGLLRGTGILRTIKS